MADAPVVPATPETPVVPVVPPVDPDASKTYSRKEFLEVASEKKMLADRAKTLEAELKTIKDAETKAANDKAIAEGKSTELYQAAQKENESMKARLAQFEANEKKLRDSALAKLDEKLRPLAEKLPDVDSVLQFVQLHTENKLTPFNGRPQGQSPDGKQYKTFEEMKAANPGMFG